MFDQIKKAHLCHQTLFPEWNWCQKATKTKVNLVQHVKFMVKQTDTTITHKLTVSVYTHDACLTAMKTMLRSGRQDQATWLTVTKFAYLGYLSTIFTQHLLLDWAKFTWHFEELDILFFLPDYKLTGCLFKWPLNVTKNCTIQAFKLELKSLFFPVNIIQVFYLPGGHQLGFKSIY